MTDPTTRAPGGFGAAADPIPGALATFAGATGADGLLVAALDGGELRVVAASDPTWLGRRAEGPGPLEPALAGARTVWTAEATSAFRGHPILGVGVGRAGVALALREAEPPARTLVGFCDPAAPGPERLHAQLEERLPLLVAHFQATDAVKDLLDLFTSVGRHDEDPTAAWPGAVLGRAAARVGAAWALTAVRRDGLDQVERWDRAERTDPGGVRAETLLERLGTCRWRGETGSPIDALRADGVGGYVGHTAVTETGGRVHAGLAFAPGAWCGWRQETLVVALGELLALELERRAAIDERLRLERVLAERQRSESLTAVARGVAHDLNNVLGIVSANAALAQEADTPPEERQASLEDIVVSAGHGAELARQLSMYAGSQPTRRRSVEVGDLLRRSERLLRAAALGDARFVRIPPPRRTWTTADPVQLRQVLVNLVANAAEALAGRTGTITVTGDARDASRADLADALVGQDVPPGRFAVLRVADDGPGIPPEVLARVCEPFFSTKGSNRGLGLSAVRGLVAAHGGALRVETTPGRGTVFEILLPAADPEPTGREGP